MHVKLSHCVLLTSEMSAKQGASENPLCWCALREFFGIGSEVSDAAAQTCLVNDSFVESTTLVICFPYM